MKRVYLDHNATTPLRPEAVEAWWNARDAVNASSLHEDGRRARAVVEAARARVAALLRAPEREIVFTSGGTESIVAAVRGICDDAPSDRRALVVSAVEHAAVLHAVEGRRASGFRVVRVPVDRDGRVDPDAFVRAIDGGAALAALQSANPETGVVQPVEEIAERCRRAGVPLLVDAVQSVGKLAVGPEGIPGDLVAISAHKIGGPQGVGALRVRGDALSSALIPGIQERRRRGGTEAVALLAAFGAAAAAAPDAARLRDLRDRLEARLAAGPVGATIHGREAPRLPNTTLFSVPGLRGEMLAIAADLAGFSVSTGSACASGAVEPSHVLLAMGRSEEEARRAVRVSLGWTTTAQEVEAFAEALPGWILRAHHAAAP